MQVWFGKENGFSFFYLPNETSLKMYINAPVKTLNEFNSVISGVILEYEVDEETITPYTTLQLQQYKNLCKNFENNEDLNQYIV